MWGVWLTSEFSCLCINSPCSLALPVFKNTRSAAYLPDSELDGALVSPRISPVPTPPKSTQPNPSPKSAMPFEEALSKLETIVEAMESGDLPLESLIAKYEDGVKLAKVCQEKLAEAELKIQQLEKSAAGELKLKPLVLDEE